MTPSVYEARGVLLRLTLWLPVLFWAAWKWSWDYADLFRPLYRAVLSHLLQGFQFGDIQIIHTHEYLFEAPYMVEAMQVIAGHVISRMDGSVQVPVYFALIHPIMLAAAALAWPGLSWKGRLVRLIMSLPVLVVVEAVDIPLVIYSSISDILAQTYDPQYSTSKPVDWVSILEGGGRFALCIASAVVAAELHKAWGRMKLGAPVGARF